MSGSHGGGCGVEVDGSLAGGDGAVDYGLGEGAAQGKSASHGTDPETLELPGFWGDGAGQGAPGYEAGGLGVNAGDEGAAALLEVAVGEAGGFLLQSSKAKAGGAGLGDDEVAVFEEKLAGLSELVFRSVCG